ncbi:MAG: hypothetical protein IT269_11690 [Saprospiraceae bacterium]|nr:hypothetical protein [Saprospiraceae bacterium]
MSLSSAPKSIVIAGAGLSGLTLALELSRHDFFQETDIILLDRDSKQRNDRTWCFWARSEETLPPVVYKRWSQCRFFAHDGEVGMDIRPYYYHMVRGIDYYQWASETLGKAPNVRRIQCHILDLETHSGAVITDQGTFQGDWVFNSALSPVAFSPTLPGLWPESPTTVRAGGGDIPGRYVHLLQHFKGWMIETPKPAFDPDQVYFMDYRIEQGNDTRFVYVLPLSASTALVEYTLFSSSLLTPEGYDAALKGYIEGILGIQDYSVTETEFGIIPMTDFPLSPEPDGKVFHIGTTGGFVKASSGYAFLRTQRRIRQFVAQWVATGQPDARTMISRWHYRFFDSVMLRVLKENLVPGHAFFSRLFQRLPAPLVFRFLDEDATPGEIVRLLSAPPTWPFLKTAIKRFWR